MSSLFSLSAVPRSTQISTVVDFVGFCLVREVPRSTQISTVVDSNAFRASFPVPRSTQISTVVDRYNSPGFCTGSKEYTNFYCCRLTLMNMYWESSKEYTNFYCCRWGTFRGTIWGVPRSTQISTVVDIKQSKKLKKVPRSTQISTVVNLTQRHKGSNGHMNFHFRKYRLFRSHDWT